MIILEALTEDFQEERVLKLGDEQRDAWSLDTKMIEERPSRFILMVGKTVMLCSDKPRWHHPFRHDGTFRL